MRSLRMVARHVAASAGVALLVALGQLLLPHAASAQYIENNLVDDNIFLNAVSLNQAQIQIFLNGRGGYLAGYNTFSDRDGATISAAQIIYEAAQDYGINPQVIIATLQKEQSLITAKNPTTSQLNFAMGYGCPDSSGCGSKYSGFFKQVDNATWQLRMNFERARGNTTWWDSKYGFACGGATRYYSTGLYVGRTVTFYDDYGTAYKTLMINNAATSSMYCYTPHAYPGSANQYYSGSYNFVAAFEQWFGSTQPAVQVVSPLTVSSTTARGLYTGRPITVSFKLRNTTGADVDVGQIGVAGYDSHGVNTGYPLRHVIVPAYGSYTYTETQVLEQEETYDFWITDYINGVWNSSYPTSSSIDQPRSAEVFVQAMPQLSATPAFSPTEQRLDRATTASFIIHNPSAASVDMGKVALAVYGPQGQNYGFALVPVVIPAGKDYTYSAAQTWRVPGTYTAFLTATPDNGISWDTNLIESLGGAQKSFSFTVLPSPTLTQGPVLTVASPHVGQQVNASFVIRNYSDTQVSAGKVGLAIYGPQGQNVGLPLVDLTVNANSDLTYQHAATFTVPGTYTAWVTVYRNGLWDDTTYPTRESDSVQRKVTFVVLPSPTITVQPAISPAQPRAGQQVTATYTITNYGDTSVSVGKTGLAAYDSAGGNVGFGLEDVTVPAHSSYVYSESGVFSRPGTHTAWVTVYRNGLWDDTTYPVAESSSINRRFSFTVLPSPTLTQGPVLTVASPHVGQQVNASFVIRNYSDTQVSAGKVGLAIYGPQGQNVGLPLVDLTVNANSDLTYQHAATFTVPGTYTAWVTVYRNGLWDDTTYPTRESDSVQRKVTFVVLP